MHLSHLSYWHQAISQVTKEHFDRSHVVAVCQVSLWFHFIRAIVPVNLAIFI